MNSSPYLVPALVFLAAVLLGCATWAALAIASRPCAGKHARQAPASTEAAAFSAYLRGEPGPQECPAPPRPGHPDQPDEPDWWDQGQHREAAVEILTGPGAPSPQTSEVLIGVLARVRDKYLAAPQ